MINISFFIYLQTRYKELNLNNLKYYNSFNSFFVLNNFGVEMDLETLNSLTFCQSYVFSLVNKIGFMIAYSKNGFL